MPRGKVVKKPREVTVPIANNRNSDSAASEDSIEIQNSPDLSESQKDEIEPGNEDGYRQDFNGEMSKLLQRFNSDMTKTMQAKRKKLEEFTQESTRSTTKKVLEANKVQSIERRRLIDHFQEQFVAVIQQGENELEKIKDSEDKLQKLLVQQQKQQQQIRIGHSQRMKLLKTLCEEYCKGMSELEETHIEQYSAVHNELRKEMALLQKKILMDTQQQEMTNVRKHLKQLTG